MNWFYIDEAITDGDRRQGPFTTEEILEKARAGEITEETLVWHSGMEAWSAWGEQPESKRSEETDELIQKTLEALIKEKERAQAEAKRHYAGFWVRALAYIIDSVFIGILAMLTTFLLAHMGLLDFEAANAIIQSGNIFADVELITKLMEVRGMDLVITASTILQFLYFVLFTWKYAATPGKRILKIKVIGARGERLGLSGSVIRYLCSVVSSFSLIYFYGLAYIIAAVDPEKRTLHDWLARTRVIYSDQENF